MYIKIKNAILFTFLLPVLLFVLFVILFAIRFVILLANTIRTLSINICLDLDLQDLHKFHRMVY